LQLGVQRRASIEGMPNVPKTIAGMSINMAHRKEKKKL